MVLDILFDGINLDFCSAGNLFLWCVYIVFEMMSCFRHDKARSVYSVNPVGNYLRHYHDVAIVSYAFCSV